VQTEEPTYEYVRGTGWVLNGVPEVTRGTCHCGTKVRVIERTPRDGEPYFQIPVTPFLSGHYDWWEPDGSLKLESVQRHLSSFVFAKWAKFHGPRLNVRLFVLEAL
jgi:hypothetical protein